MAIPFQQKGYLVLFGHEGQVIFGGDNPDDELIFLQHTAWYDEKDWMLCEKMKSDDEAMKHFGVERRWGN